MPRKFNSPDEEGKKLKLLRGLFEIYRITYTDSAVDLMLATLEGYSSESIAKATPIMLRNIKEFSLAELTTVIEHYGFNDPEDEPLIDKTPHKLTRAEFIERTIQVEGEWDEEIDGLIAPKE